MQFYESVEGYIATECPVCGSRLYFRPEQAGRSITCGMCEVSVAIPQQINVKPKPKPIRRHVEAYEVRADDEPAADASPPQSIGETSGHPSPYSVAEDQFEDDADPIAPSSDATQGDERSAGAQRARRTKDAFLLVCGQCSNRMYPRIDQEGEQIACPVCGSVSVVPSPQPKSKPKPPPKPEPADVSDEPPPEWSHIERPDERPVQSHIPPVEHAVADPPRWTFFTGVASFLWKGRAPLYFAMLSLTLVLIGEILALGLSANQAGGYAMIITLYMIAFFAIILVWVLSFSAACFFGIMQDTANGADEITSWPEGSTADRLTCLTGMLFQLSLAASISFGIGKFASIWFGPIATPIGACAAAIALFPFFAISALESNRMFSPFSAMVFASLFRLWWGWLLVYLETTLLLAVWAISYGFAFLQMPFLAALWGGPLLAAVAMICARLYGRLIWLATQQKIERDVRAEEDVAI